MSRCYLVTRFIKITIINSCIFVWLISPIKASEDEDRPSLNPQDLYFEFLTFRGNDGEQTYLEVFCQIPKEQLSYAKTGRGFQGDYTLSLTVYNSFDRDVEWATHRDSVVASTRSQVLELNPVVVHIPLFLAPGEYKIMIQFTDLNSLAMVKFLKNIYIPDYRDQELHLSSLQLASKISPASMPSRLVKNGVKIVPIVHHIFREQLHKVFVYFEVYNLYFRAKEPKQSFRVDYTILDLLGTEIKSIGFLREKLSSSTFVGLAIPFTGLSHGTYRLEIKIKDLHSLKETEKSAYFSLVKPGKRFVDYKPESLPTNLAN